jgi:hypothetical protein
VEPVTSIFRVNEESALDNDKDMREDEQDYLPNQLLLNEIKFYSITDLDGQARSGNKRSVSGPHILLSPGIVTLSMRQPAFLSVTAESTF